MEIKKERVGVDGPLVSKLCFGTLPMGPRQVNLPVETGADIIRYAIEQGINFIDTAEVYDTYKYVREAIKDINRDNLVIASKSPAADYNGMKEHIEKGLTDLEIDYFDIFHLHAAREENPFSERTEALNCLVDYKSKGLVKYIGIATHYVKVVKEAAEQEDIDVIFAIINQSGRGIVDGTPNDMLEALAYAQQKGKGIYAMKALAGGNLLDSVTSAINFVRQRPFINSTAVGMVKKEEVEVNKLIFSDKELTKDLLEKTNKKLKKLRILNSICKLCGNCIEECPNFALSIEDEKVLVEYDKCIICGYCTRVCPQFAIRLA